MHHHNDQSLVQREKSKLSQLSSNHMESLLTDANRKQFINQNSCHSGDHFEDTISYLVIITMQLGCKS